MGQQKNIITRERLILGMWFIEQKFILFQFRTDIRDEPAQPWRSLTANSSNLLKDTSLKLSHNKFTGFKIVLSNFHREFFIKSEVITFFAKLDFCHFYTQICVYLKNHLIFPKSDYLTWKTVWRSIRITVGFILKISFIRYKIDFSGQIDLFSPYFFWKIGPGRAYYGLFTQFKLQYNFSSKK